MNIKIENLSKQYHQQWALNDISLQIKGNEVVALLGPNGAGKTTLMKSIVGSIVPTQGSVFVKKHNVQKEPLLTRKKIGYLAENNPLYQEMFVKEYLSFVARIRQCSKKAIQTVIEEVGLTQEQSKKIKELSKGYKQRVGIAQAIIHQPDILILDEPTNGLDPNQIIEIRNLIKKIAKGKTVIISTHIMQEVEALCDRVVILNQGKLMIDQPLDELKQQYNTLEEAFQRITTHANA